MPVETDPTPSRRLSQRLATVARVLSTYVGRGSVVADIGAGRGELSLYLAERRLSRLVISADVSPKAVRILAEILGSLALDDAVAVRCGDGLTVLSPGEADAVVLAGIGGRLAVELLAAGLPRVVVGGAAGAGPVVVVQPMSQPGVVRNWAEAHVGSLGYRVGEELLSLDSGRYYHTFVLVPTGPAPRAGHSSQGPATGPESRSAMRAAFGPVAYRELGPYLLAGPDPLLRGWLDWRLGGLTRLCAAIGDTANPRGQARAHAAKELVLALAATRLALAYTDDQEAGSTGRCLG